jgi:hypothetical protein
MGEHSDVLCPEPWNTPVCNDFRDNDQGICMECGHLKACHEFPSE